MQKIDSIWQCDALYIIENNAHANLAQLNNKFGECVSTPWPKDIQIKENGS